MLAELILSFLFGFILGSFIVGVFVYYYVKKKLKEKTNEFKEWLTWE